MLVSFQLECFIFHMYYGRKGKRKLSIWENISMSCKEIGLRLLPWWKQPSALWPEHSSTRFSSRSYWLITLLPALAWHTFFLHTLGSLHSTGSGVAGPLSSLSKQGDCKLNEPARVNQGIYCLPILPFLPSGKHFVFSSYLRKSFPCLIHKPPTCFS